MDVTVVGAGIVGLTTALTLEERGHRVRIVARASALECVSGVAGALWFPYRAGPPERVVAWAARTRVWLESLAHDREAGIDLLTGYEITDEADDAAPPWWAASLEVARVPAPVRGAPLAWRFRAPRVEPARFVRWISSRLRASIERREVRELADEAGDAVIDCTGLGARELARDESLQPLLGQVVLTERGGADPAITIADERDPDAIFYVIPRREELVLGGCSVPWPPGETPRIDPALTARILDQARAHGIGVGAVREVRVGLRPFRPEVRVERDSAEPRVIHSYGHGGAGYTVCRGCAEDVAAMLGG